MFALVQHGIALEFLFAVAALVPGTLCAVSCFFAQTHGGLTQTRVMRFMLLHHVHVHHVQPAYL